MATDLKIEVRNRPGELARITAAIADAGVNVSAVTCDADGSVADLHILVPHAEAAKHALATAGVTITHQEEVVVIDVIDAPGVVADLTRRVAEAGVNIDLLYVATHDRLVFGAEDVAGLREALGVAVPAPA